MWQWIQKLEWQVCKLRTTKDCWQPTRSWKRQERTLQWGLQGALPPTPWFQTSNFQNYKITSFFFLFFLFFFFGSTAWFVGLVSEQELNLGPWQWKYGYLTTGQPGNSQNFCCFKHPPLMTQQTLGPYSFLGTENTVMTKVSILHLRSWQQYKQ